MNLGQWRIDRTDGLIGGMAILGVSCYVAAAALLNRVGFPLDDAWIHQVYGRNLGDHAEWAFLLGQPSAASTAPLFTFLLAIGYALHIPFFVWTFALGSLTLAAAGWIGRRLGMLLFPDLPSAGLWIGLAIVTAWHLVWATASGMETMLFVTLSLALVRLGWRELSHHQAVLLRGTMRRGAVVGLVGGALTLTRPEGMGLVGLTAALVLIAWPDVGRGSGRRSYVSWAGGVIAAWLAVTVPYFGLNLHLGGDLLPNTAAAKQAEYAYVVRQWSLAERYVRLAVPLLAGGLALLLPGVAAGIAHTLRSALLERRAWLLLLPLAWVVVDMTAYVFSLPVNYQHGRYIMPVLPYLLLYGVGGTLRIVHTGRRTPIQRVLSRSLALSALAASAGFWWIGAQQYARDVRIINTEMVATAKWIHAHLPSDEVLAVHDIGAVGYYAPRPIFDLAGLISPEVIPIIRQPEALMEMMCERDIHYLMALPEHRPAPEFDARLGPAPIFVTDTPFAVEAGGGNMAVYALQWPDDCR